MTATRLEEELSAKSGGVHSLQKESQSAWEKYLEKRKQKRKLLFQDENARCSRVFKWVRLSRVPLASVFTEKRLVEVVLGGSSRLGPCGLTVFP